MTLDAGQPKEPSITPSAFGPKKIARRPLLARFRGFPARVGQRRMSDDENTSQYMDVIGDHCGM